QRNVRADAGECHRRALLDLYLQVVRQEAHHRRRFHPGNLLQLLLALRQGDKEDIASDVTAHQVHDLGTADVVVATHFDVVAGFYGETPRVRAVLHGHAGYDGDQDEKNCDNRGPLQPVSGFPGERPSTYGDTLLRAQKRRFLLGFQVNQAGIVQRSGNILRTGREFQVVLGRWNASTRHQPYSVVVENRRSHYSCFRSKLRQQFFHREVRFIAADKRRFTRIQRWGISPKSILL